MNNLFYTITLALFFIWSCKNSPAPQSESEQPLEESTAEYTASAVKSNGNVTIMGNKDYEFEMDFEEGTYLVVFKQKTMGALKNFSVFIETLNSWNGLMPFSASSLNDESGYYETADIASFSSTEKLKYKVEASGEYIIEYKKLPLDKENISAPITFGSKGSRVFGPIELSGEATFKIICEDAAKAGFSVQLYNAETGEEILNENYMPLYVNIEDGKAVNSINKTVSLNNLSGIYLINVDANGRADYSITVE